MEPIIKKTIEKSPIELKNYCNTVHTFSTLFPADEFDFSETDFTHFFYFDNEEAQIYFNDFKRFVVRVFQINMFRTGLYYDVVEQFAKYLAKQHVFFFNRTMVGISMSVKNNNALYRILMALDPTLQVNDEKNPLVFAFGEIDQNRDYSLPFFSYLEKKLKGYNYSKKYIIEPLVEDDLNRLAGVFKGVKYVGNTPFFLNAGYKNVKMARSKILSDFLTDASFTWCVSLTADDSIVALINVVTVDGGAKLNILCDSGYYDLDFKEVLKYVSNYTFQQLGANKITCFNDNVELSYSLINSSLTVAGFKPNYLQESGANGYSKIEYTLKKSDYEFEEFEQNKLVIRFNF